MSKAWSFYECEESIIEIVFADTRGKARMYLKELDTFDNYRYIEISPRREKALDYLNHEDGYVMDWNKEEDKIALVKNIGVYCLDADKDECKECCAKEWCSKYEEYEEEEDD